MKYKSLYTQTVILLILSATLSTHLSAQSWVWGKAGTVTGCDAFPIATDPAGNVFCAGLRLPEYGTGSIDFGSGVTSPSAPGAYQSIWVEYNNAGTPLWAGGTLSGDTWINSVAADPSGNFIVFGSFNSATMQIGSYTFTNSYATGTGQYFLAKYNSAGTLLWAIKDGNILSTYINTFGPYILGAGGVGTDAAGNIYITGSFDKPSMTIGSTTLTNTGAAGTFDVFVVKYSPSGAPLWASSMGGTGNDYSQSLAVASTGDIWVGGFFYSPSITIGSSVITDPYPNQEAFVAKFSSTGSPLWGQAAGAANGAFVMAIASDNSGNIYATGGFKDNSISFGAITLTRTYPASVPALAEFLVKYSPAGVATWAKTIGSNTSFGGTWGWSLAVAPCGTVWVSGNYSADVSIEGTILPVIPGGTDPVFVAGYNLGGGLAGYSGLGSGGDDQNGIACDGNGNVFLCSDYEGNPFSIGPDVMPPVVFPESFYLAKFGIAATDTVHRHQDTTICGVDSILLTPPSGYGSYIWNNGSSGPALNVGTSGTFWVLCQACGDTTLADTFHVTIAPTDTTYKHTDTSICLTTGSAILSGPAGYSAYVWNNGSTSSTISISAAGIFYVIAYSGCGMLIDTFHVSIIPVVNTSSNSDTSLCTSSGPITLMAPPGYGSYLWNTGSTASTINVTTSGKYWVKSSNNCMVNTDTTKVIFNPSPLVSLGTDTTICTGQTITISSTQPAGATFLWNTGSTSSSIQVSAAGTYLLTVTINGCSASDSETVNITSSLAPVNLGPDTTLCLGDVLYLTVNSANAYWSDYHTGNQLKVVLPGTYWVTIKSPCGSVSDTIVVDYQICDLYFPSAFTPNGDGLNETIGVVGEFRNITDFSLSIYNRWGERVYYSHDIYAGWNGTYKGVKQDVGTFFYMILYSFEGTRHMMKGDLQLIR